MAGEPKGDRILIVDDDDSIRELCTTTFLLEGYQVQDAASGEQAVKLLDKQAFDVVLTDLFMPGSLDGHGVVRAVKTRFPRTAAVVMTAVPTLRTAIATLKDGASDYVIKPFDTDHLRIVVRKALDAQRLREELSSERSMRQELASAYEELQKVEKLKESFLARISHELRTPLSELLTSVDLMAGAAEGGADLAKLQRYLGLAKTGAKRLDRVVSDLLSFVELQSRPAVERTERVELEPLCREVIEKLKPLWEPRKLAIGVRFKPGVPAVSGDRALLARAFEHLIQNAVIFNKDEGSITIEASEYEGKVLLSVADTGEGIPEGEFDKIFDSFYQIANYLTRKVGGLGLGLAITRRIIEAHGGEVAVSSKVGEGTSFRLRLPGVP